MDIAANIAAEYKNADDKKSVIICGPTASGKSDVAMELAYLIGGEIVSCDSMQIYRLMDIGTAKATKEMREKVPHHMIDIVDPWENYNVFMYKKAAREVINDIISRGKVPVICGGTGLYVNTLIDNRTYSDEPEGTFFSEELRLEKENCDRLFENGDRDALHELLTKYDPEAANEIHKNNVKRVYRVLCLYFITGKVRSLRNELSHEEGPDLSFMTFCLMPGREDLYKRIDKRVDIMRELGLMDEVKTVYAACREKLPQSEVYSLDILKLTALNAMGYKELIPLLDFSELKALRTLDEDASFDKIKQNSRQYAKRQITLFKKTPGTSFIEI